MSESRERRFACTPLTAPVTGRSSNIDKSVDYRCSTMAGIPARQVNRLQSVLNAAARLVYSARRTEHVSPLLRELHWLRVPHRIEFRLAVLANRLP